jgi:restriction endonuclease S subunit
MKGNTTLQQICNIRIGHAFRGHIASTENGSLAVIQPKNISAEGTLDASKVEFIDSSTPKPSQRLKDGDILFVSRGRLAATVYHDELAAHCIASGALFVLTMLPTAPVNAEFIALYLNSKEGKTAISRLNAHTTASFLNRSNLGQLEIPIPTAPIQQTLVALNQKKKRYLDLTARKAAIIDRVIGYELKQNT